MNSEKKIARWKQILGYVLFTTLSFLMGMFLTFPYDVLQERIRVDGQKQGYDIKIGSMGPGLGIVAKNVKVKKISQTDEDQPSEPLEVEKISFRPTLFPPGVAANMKLMDGAIALKVGYFRKETIELDVEDINLAKGNFKGISGIDAEGRLSAHVDISFPLQSNGKGPNEVEPDFGAANGEVQIQFTDVTIKGGTVKMVIPAYGPEPTPLDLPKVPLGNFRLNLPIDKGTGTLKTLELKGTGIECKGTGSVKLAKNPDYSELNFELKLKAESSFKQSLGPYGAALSTLRTVPNEPDWKILQLTGFPGRPNFR